jgi:ATP-dependent DNA helicase RecG
MDAGPMHDDLQSGLSSAVRFVRGVGGSRAEQFARMGIFTLEDLLLALPRRYEDRQQLLPMNALASGQWATVYGAVVTAAWVRPRFGKGYFEAVLGDGKGFVRCRWFSAAYLKDQVRNGERLVAFGKVSVRKGEAVMQHPDFEVVREEGEESIHMGRIVPVYALTEGFPQRTMRRILWNALQLVPASGDEMLPAVTLQRARLMSRADALRCAHFPPRLEDAQRARVRLAFEEFLCMQLVLVARKIQAERHLVGMAHRAAGDLRRQFLASLPFQLTRAQSRVLEEIRQDMEKPHPMHRLLQGDVGSGKTVVAACALLDAIECGAQGAVMAPTEILAAQHFRTLGEVLKPLNIPMQLLSGSLTDSEKISARARIADGRTRLVVGTHALIEDRVVFQKLGLVVIDEQHKFGVVQRGVLYGKGAHPDVLVMTATPIPRTLAMTLYGDLDVSVIDEMPAGRQEVVTRVIKAAQLPDAYGFIRKQAGRGRQAYLVYPLVSESDQLELKSAEAMYEKLKAGDLAGLRLGLVHGQMPAAQKDRVMQDFRAGRIDVLVATTVVEVGVDVPNANVMLVENAERFGLAQLHQLRGRIGRGANKSFCILEASPAGLDAWKRLRIMEQTTDGFRIAEEDFRIRGMGNLMGREQSGSPVLRVGDPLADARILEAARAEAEALLEDDPRFEKPEYEPLRARARALYRQAAPFVKVG